MTYYIIYYLVKSIQTVTKGMYRALWKLVKEPI